MNKKDVRVFDTNQCLRLGIWGRGRSRNFNRTCALLNIDVVAGRDYNEHLCKHFLKTDPGAKGEV